MIGDSRDPQYASGRAEAMGWLAFLIFVAGIYRLRHILNRSVRER